VTVDWSMDLADLRIDYRDGDFDEAAHSDDPIGLFGTWLEAAVAAGVREPNAMAVATVDANGAPSVRIVLLRQIVDGDLLFFTNLESAKGIDLRREPRCAATFWWGELERQVRITGRAVAVPRERAAAYFASRPRPSQLGAWASPQSRPLASREALVARVEEVAQRFEGQDVPLPPHWGGFAITPIAIEFWQGRPSRLHDRVRFERQGPRWVPTRLAP
jgi:pyridoxamine 5'-phosphate oxidase